jgi:peroxiredoxin
VVHALDDPGVERLKGFGIDVERWSKRKHHKIAIPGIFLMGQDGKVKFAHAAKDYETRPDTQQLLAALKKLNAK